MTKTLGIKKQYINYLNSGEGARKYNEFKKVLYGHPDSLVLRLFVFLLLEFQGQTKIKVLDIGGGDGKRLAQLIDLFAKKNIQIEADLVDPSLSLTKSCEKRAEVSGHKIRVLHSRFEEVPGSQLSSYDLVFVIHSYFTLEDDIYLKKIKNILAENGLLVIAGNDENSFLAKLKKICDESYSSQRKEIGSIIEDLKANYFQFHVEKFETIFPAIFKRQEISEKSKHIISWICLRDYLNIPAAILRKANDLFWAEKVNRHISEQEILIIAEKSTTS